MSGAALNRRGHPTTSGAQSSSTTKDTALKFPKQTTAYALSPSLVGGQKGGAPLARRSSASFNHVRTSSLVSSSPFKQGENLPTSPSTPTDKALHDPSSPQHVATRSLFRRSIAGDHKLLPQIHNRARSDENKYSEQIRMSRESKGLDVLSKASAVSKSPFVEANGARPTPRHAHTVSEDVTRDFSDSSFESRTMIKSATFPTATIDKHETLTLQPPILSSSGPSSRLSSGTNSPISLTPSRPLPDTPQRQTASPVPPSPRSSLVSKRMIGPRSPEELNRSTPGGGSIRRKRKKSVTWDERCDVVEFDQDEEEEVEFALEMEDSSDVDHSDEHIQVHGHMHVDEGHHSQGDEGDEDYGEPIRDGDRSPSPVLSDSHADTADDFEKQSINSLSTNNGTATPQMDTADLPEENEANYRNDYEAHLAGLSNNNMFSGGNSSLRDSTSTIDDSFTRRLKEEPEVETSFRLAESRSPERFPRISRDGVRRQIEQQHFDDEADSFTEPPVEARSRLSIASMNNRSGSNSPFNRKSRDASPAQKPEELFNSTFRGNGPDVNLEDVHSALDRLMLGVEKGFEPSITSTASEVDAEEEVEEVEEADISFAPSSYGQRPAGSRHTTYQTVEMEGTDPAEVPILRESTGMSGTSTETTDGPFTPQLHTSTLGEPFPSREKDPEISMSTSKPLPPPPPEDSPTSSPRQFPTLSPEPSPPPSPRPGRPTSLFVGEVIYRPSSPLLSAPGNGPVRKNTIKRHEEAIKAKRREQRAAEGRPSRRRSQSTGDLRGKYGDDEPEELTIQHDEVELSDAIQHEVAKLNPNKKTYMMRPRRPTIYASDSKVGRISNAGDVQSVKAWRAVRRLSDMNEYSRQIRQLRSQETATNAHGKVFVKVVGIKSLNLPMPANPTYFTCVLHNGIHSVETPASRLEEESLIDQEFELTEHEKLEFTLTIRIRKDPHIAKILNPAPRPLSVPARVETPSKAKGGMRSFFSNPSKRASKQILPPQETILPPIETSDPFGRYLKKDLSIARALVSFKDVVNRCDMKLFETSYPLVGQQANGPEVETKTVGEIVLQLFRLPPLPGIPAADLPQSLEECQRGLRHMHWHKVVYHEGILTQLGGDCTTWRRRHLQVMGANLIAFNDITKKPISTMDLRKVTLVEDDPKHGVAPTIIRPPAVAVAEGSLQIPKILRRQRSFNVLHGIDHSFRVVFDDNESDEICFFADSAEEKRRWMEIFGALVGRIPHNPLWAELLWQRQQGHESE